MFNVLTVATPARSSVQQSSLSTWRLAVFALPAAVSAIMHGPIAGVLPAIYASRFGIDLAFMGAVMLLTRVFDAVTDPLIGYLSDRTQSRFGQRKPWVVAGTVVTVTAMWFVFRPIEGANGAYLLWLLLLLYLGWTISEIPYGAWVAELSRDTRERARIYAFRSAAFYAGGIAFTVAPALVPGTQGRMGFEALGVLAIVLAIAAPLATLAAVALVPRGQVYAAERPRLAELWKSVRANPPFKAFVAAYAFIGLASGVANVIGFIYIDSYLGIGNRFTELFLPATLLGPVTLPFWAWLLRRHDKYRVTAIAFTVYAAIMPLPWFISPGAHAIVPMLLYYCGLTLFYPLLMISMPTILGDVIDYDEWQTGKNRAGQYSSFLVLISKATAAAGGPLALLIVGLFGYQPGANNDVTAVLGLRIVFNVLPAVLVLPGLLLLWRFPMNDARHVEIRAALERRHAAAEPTG